MPVRSAFVQIAASTWRKPADPQVFGIVDVDFTAGGSFIERYNRRFGARITPTHLVGRAAGLILAKFPLSNAKIGLSRVWLRNSADVYFTIATGGGTDLFGYKVAAVDAMRLVDLERSLRTATKAIRDGSDKGYARSRRIALALPIFILRPFAALASFATNVLGLDLSSMGFPRDAFGGAGEPLGDLRLRRYRRSVCHLADYLRNRSSRSADTGRGAAPQTVRGLLATAARTSAQHPPGGANSAAESPKQRCAHDAEAAECQPAGKPRGHRHHLPHHEER